MGLVAEKALTAKAKMLNSRNWEKKISKLEKKSQNCKIEKGNCKAGKNIQML